MPEFSESMSLACQWGKCEDCPDDRAWSDACVCGCHLPDPPEYEPDED